MAGFAQDFLKGAEAGFFGNEYLRDFQHASKIFRSNNYANAPKYKFLFHVYFEINHMYLPSDAALSRDSNPGILVKSIDLPKFNMKVEELNQYNRKRLVQTHSSFDPISIVMHDDNDGIIKDMWYSYYSYYYKDPSQNGGTEITKTVNMDTLNSHAVRNIYSSNVYKDDDWGYIGESSTNAISSSSDGFIGDVKAPFFNSIKIFGFNQHRFTMYKLINPIIENFSHDTYDYSQGAGVMENKMSVRFENVKYFTGSLDGAKPEQTVDLFGLPETYDKVLSPIARPGSQSTILGQGGLISGVGGFMDDIESGNIFGAIQKAGATYKTFSKPGAISGAVKDDLNRGINNDGVNPSRNTLFNFPNITSSRIVPVLR